MHERYLRNEMCAGFGSQGQARLKAGSVLVLGSGGLGGFVLQELAAAGVGRICIVEFDFVSESNLNRQILFSASDIGRPKAECALERLKALNPEIDIFIEQQRLSRENAAQIFDLASPDVVVDCTDNFEARYVIDEICGQRQLPFVHASVEAYRGSLSVFHGGKAGSYAELFGDEMQTLSPVGVLSPVVGTLASLQAMEVLKILSGIGEVLYNKLLVVDLQTASFQTLELDCF